MEEISRRFFLSLKKIGVGEYVILNDGYFCKNIYVNSDEEAIRIFNNYHTN